jgi:adenylate cyclase
LTRQNQITCRLRFEGETRARDILFVLGETTATLGRAPECDLVLNHESVSREHARFSFDGESWTIEDLGSKNGVRINTYRVEHQRLRDGDRIDLGTARLHVEIGPFENHTTHANVVFSKKEDRALHTEVLELSALTSLLSSEEAKVPAQLVEDARSPLVAPAAPPSLAELGDEAFGLAHLVTDAAEALITCTTLDETLDRILALVFDNLPAQRGVICLHDEVNNSTEPMVMRTLNGVPNEPITISNNIANHVINRKQALLVKDTRMDDRFGGADSVIMMEIQSAMCAPLYHDGRVAGFIYVDRQSGSDTFSTPHLHMLSALAMLSAVAVETAALRDDIQHEKELRSRLARYSSPTVIDRILLAPGSTERGMVADDEEVTILFADLKGFTEMAESLPPAEVIQILNRVFERLTEVVFRQDGTLDKFRGDGMMAFFGAPLPMPDHARRAVETALQMQEAVHELNSDTGFLRDLRIRIGINSGQVVVGDIGSPQRKDYTVIGDAVNIASRLESQVAEPGQVVIGRTTYEAVADHFECQPLDVAQVKGKQESVHPYLVTGRKI